MRDVFHLVGKEGAATGRRCKILEDLVAAQNQAAIVGRNGIDQNFGPLRHFNRLSASVFALIVFSIAEDDDRLANRMIGMVAQQLLLAGLVDRIVQRRAAAVIQVLHTRCKQRHLVGEILGQMALFVKADHECPIVARTDDVLQESGRRVFFKTKASLHRPANVHEQSQFNRQVGFAAEVQDRFDGLVVIEDRKIILIQITDKLAVTVGRNEQHVNFINALFDCQDRFIRFLSRTRNGGRATCAHRNTGSRDDIGRALRASEGTQP